MKGKTGKKNLVPVVKKCDRCGNDFLASSNYVHFCDECSVIVKKDAKERHNKSRLIAKQNKLLNGVEGEDYIIDLWNGLPTTRIAGRWIKERHPGRTIDEYKKEFPYAPLVCGKMSKRISESSK